MSEKEEEEQEQGEQKEKKSDVDRLIMAMHTAEIARPSSSLWDLGKINQTTELYDDEINSFSELQVVESIYKLDMLRATTIEFMLERRSLDRKTLDALLMGGGY